jgi:hypothetical protein
MRFSIAVGILVQTLAASSKSDKKNVLWQRNHGRKQRLHASMTRNGATAFKAPDHNVGFGSGYPVLQNSAAKSTVVDCDPRSSDPDVGILSCGVGRYCMESQDHDLGGICTDESTAVGDHRDLQVLDVDAIVSLCDPSSPIYEIYDCDCTNWNDANSTGFFECVLFEGFCFDPPANTVCTNTLLAADFASDSTYTVSYCYDFFQPYDQSVCFNYNSAGACSIDFNDMTCNSCQQIYLNNVETLTGESCLEFDCTNTDGMHEGSECAGDYVAPILEGVASPERVPTLPPVDGPVAVPTMSDMSMPMSMSMDMTGRRELDELLDIEMSMSMDMTGRRELDELLDIEFGQAGFGGASRRVAETEGGSRRIRKRL